MELKQRDMRKLTGLAENSRDKLTIRILYETGCTLKELTELRVSDIKGNRLRLNNREQRFSQISGKLSKDISRYAEGNNLSKSSKLISLSGRRISQLIEKYSEKFLNKKLTSHNLRELHIIHAYLSGVHIENIAKQLGITELRVFQIISKHNLKPPRNYGLFLKRI